MAKKGFDWDRMVDGTCRALCRAFPERHRVVPRADAPDVPMLDQFMLVPGKLYLQHFRAEESPDWFHHHRWQHMRSIVLSAFYVEERPHGKAYHTRQRGYTHVMDHDTIHRIDYWHPHCWTLFYMGDDLKDWGYYARDLRSYVPWQEFVTKRIPNLERGEVTA